MLPSSGIGMRWSQTKVCLSIAPARSQSMDAAGGCSEMALDGMSCMHWLASLHGQGGTLLQDIGYTLRRWLSKPERFAYQRCPPLLICASPFSVGY